MPQGTYWNGQQWVSVDNTPTDPGFVNPNTNSPMETPPGFPGTDPYTGRTSDPYGFPSFMQPTYPRSYLSTPIPSNASQTPQLPGGAKVENPIFYGDSPPVENLPTQSLPFIYPTNPTTQISASDSGGGPQGSYWNGQQWVNLGNLPSSQGPAAWSSPPPNWQGNAAVSGPQFSNQYVPGAGPANRIQQGDVNQAANVYGFDSPFSEPGPIPGAGDPSVGANQPQWQGSVQDFINQYGSPPLAGGQPYDGGYMNPGQFAASQQPVSGTSSNDPYTYGGPMSPAGDLSQYGNVTPTPTPTATPGDTQVILNQPQATATPGVNIDPSGAGLADPNLGPTPGATPFDPYAGPSDVLGTGGSPNYYPTGDGRYWTYDQNWQWTGTTGTPDVPPAPSVAPGVNIDPSGAGLADSTLGSGIPTAPGVTPDVASAIPIDPSAPTGNLIPDLGADVRDIGRTLGGIPASAVNAIRNAAPQGPGGWGQSPGYFDPGTAGPGPLPNLNPSGITWQDIYASGVDPRVDASGNPISVQSVPAPSGGPQIFGQGSHGSLPASLAYESINWNAPGMQGWLDPINKFNQALGNTFINQIKGSFPGYANWPSAAQIAAVRSSNQGDVQGGGAGYHPPSLPGTSPR